MFILYACFALVIYMIINWHRMITSFARPLNLERQAAVVLNCMRRFYFLVHGLPRQMFSDTTGTS